MKSLFPILGLSFLSLTLTNCSLSPEKIASRLEPSIVKIKNTSGHGTGFFVPGKPEVCTVLTAAHVLNKEKGENFLETTKDGKTWSLAKIEIFPSNIDLALVTFLPKGKKCNYPALKIGNLDRLKKGNLIYISGFPFEGGKLVSQFVKGNVKGLSNLLQGYGVSYQALTVGGMSGAPVVDGRGEVVAVHGSSDVEVVESLASKQATLSEAQQQFYQQAADRVNGGEGLTFSWGIPIALFRESEFYSTQPSEWSLWRLFSSGVIFGGGIVYFGLRHFQAPQISTERQKWERQLQDEQGRQQEVEGRLSSLENTQTQAQKELERQLEWEKGKRQEVEAQLQKQGEVKYGHIESESVATQRQRELERQLKNEQSTRQELKERLNSLENTQTQAKKELEKQLEWERGKRQEVEALLQRQGQVQPPVIEPQSYGHVPLVFAIGVDYTKLRDLLAAKKWKEADIETGKRMLEAAGRESQGYLNVQDVENFPGQDLGTIDKLWVKYSNGKFGFSVQKQIYHDFGGTKKYDQKLWRAFGIKVGWFRVGKWLSYDSLTFSENHYMGHLPSGIGLWGCVESVWVRWSGNLLSRKDL